ncbi:fumarate hydratase [Methanorbis rubei]|uniref:L(+)-tartrate dehydratase subunit alpha n=1 Tax=Methanorbis rubei TaxID=3028300 RepID=A0AAE4MG74_9EURY|nr:L(+)-tartrate dehydratase subunit alpha [Methanocorpusculaceae archaeon Cs1]
MSSLLFERLASAVAEATRDAEIFLPPDVEAALMHAAAAETNPVARGELANILENLDKAKSLSVPICQDTGIPVVYLTVPPTVPVTKELYDAISEGIRRATASVPLRPNAVDPISRHNSGDNTGQGLQPVHILPGDTLRVTVLPKGAGSENMSQIKMMLPSQTADIPKFVVDVVMAAGARPCPPIVVGVGIGGTFDGAAALAKEALLERIDVMDAYEQELCDAINTLGIGPMGLGGDTTALAVKVKRGFCHTASLPVAVNIQCWCCRRGIREVEL